MAKGKVEVSDDGINWQPAGDFEFGNLINDPSKRKYFFERVIEAKYMKITSTETAANDKTVTIAELDFFEE